MAFTLLPENWHFNVIAGDLKVPIPVKLSSESGEGVQHRSEATLG